MGIKDSKQNIQNKMEKTNKNKSVFWNSEKLLSISAIIISLGTLFVFTYQTNLIRKQQHMSVYPYLQFEDHANFSLNYKYTLTNKGIGPALITSSKIKINGVFRNMDLACHLGEAVKHITDTIYSFTTSSVTKGMLIGQNESIAIASLDSLSGRKSPEILFHLIHNDSLNFIIEYESIYGEKWQISQEDFMPVKVED